MTSQSNQVALFNQFKGEFDRRANEIATLLPSNIEPERFQSVITIAVKRMPALLLCERRSLHNAITDAAYDQIMPDGREGVIIPRFETIKVDGVEKKIRIACWQPMVRGIRRRAAELADLVIDGQVVCRNDKFEWEQGLDPILRHVPTPLDKDPGDLLGAYAVFRRNGRVLHFEVMRKGQILRVQAISKQPHGVMWKQFTDQAWIKTVVRRGSKSVPAVPHRLQQIIERHDDDFDLDGRVERQDIEHDEQAHERNPLADADGAPSADIDTVDYPNFDAADEVPAKQISDGTGQPTTPQLVVPERQAERVARRR